MVCYIHSDTTLASGNIKISDLMRVTSVVEEEKLRNMIRLTLEDPDYNFAGFYFDRPLETGMLVYSYAHEVTYS